MYINLFLKKKGTAFKIIKEKEQNAEIDTNAYILQEIQCIKSALKSDTT